MAIRKNRFDLVVVGAGPGGYVASLKAAHLGMKVACVERSSLPGGVCLNIGCIPSKALLDSSEYYHLMRTGLSDHGIRAGSIELDLGTMMARKDRLVKELGENVRKLLEGAGVELIRGSAVLMGKNTVEVHFPADGVAEGRAAEGATGSTGSDGFTGPEGPKDVDVRTLDADRVLLATGSEPIPLRGLPFDGVRIVDSTAALSFETVPQHLLIVGGGAIGLELGSVWARLGSRVTVVEMLPVIASGFDGQVSRALVKALTRRGLTFRLSATLYGAESTPGGIRALVRQAGREEEVLECDRLLAAVGRRPLTRGIGLEHVGIQRDSHTGHVLVDSRYRTNVPTIYAIGDLIAGPALAHKASAEAAAAVECMAGIPSEVNYDAIPSIVYTSPEAAGVGWTEERLRERGIRYRVGSFPPAASARARSAGETDGFVKVIAHTATDRVLGVHMVAARASEMIAEATLAMEMNATSATVAGTVHGHPSFSEALREAAAAVNGTGHA